MAENKYLLRHLNIQSTLLRVYNLTYVGSLVKLLYMYMYMIVSYIRSMYIARVCVDDAPEQLLVLVQPLQIVRHGLHDALSQVPVGLREISSADTSEQIPANLINARIFLLDQLTNKPHKLSDCLEF